MNPQMGLLILLEEEFRGLPEVRVRPVSPAQTRRAADLPQDYDPESATLHLVSGVKVFTRKREYFFPVEWFSDRPRSRIEAQILEIREQLEREA